MSILLRICLFGMLFAVSGCGPDTQRASIDADSNVAASTESVPDKPPAESLLRFELEFPAMGVVFKFIGYAPDAATAETAFIAARERVEVIESALTNYRDDSEAARLCASAPHGRPIEISKDLATVLRLSKENYQMSQGCFDPTLGHLTELWRTARRDGHIPETGAINAAKISAMNQITLSGNTVQIAVADLNLDFGGIGKGYAADIAVQVLIENGVHYSLVDASGDIRATDPPPQREHWTIEIDSGIEQQRQQLSPSNAGVATSGDLNQHTEIGEVRYSHIIDPRTGMALTGSRTVTVIAPDAATADALASVVSVLGEVEGIQFVETLPDIEARVVWRDKSGQVQITNTTGFPAMR